MVEDSFAGNRPTHADDTSERNVGSEIPGDLSSEQLDELRRNLTSTAQLRNASETLQLLATQQDDLVTAISQGESLPADTDDLLMTRLGLAEANARMAQAGLTPLSSVEGKIKALEFITRHVVETAKLEPRARLEAEQLILAYRQLLIAQDSRLQIARLEASNSELRARSQEITLRRELELKQKGEIDQLQVDAERADTERRAQRLEVSKQRLRLAEEEKKVERESAIAARAKANEYWRALKKLRAERYGALRRRTFAGIVAVIVCCNLVADQDRYANAPVVSWINRLWDFLTQPIWSGLVASIKNLF